MTRGRLRHSHLNGGISIEQRRPANLCILNEPLWSNVATRVNLPSPETLTGFETSCWTIHWHHKVHHFQEFWEGTDRPSLKTGQERWKVETWSRSREADRRLNFVLDFWAALLVAAWCLHRPVSLRVSLQLRAESEAGPG